MAGNSDRTGTAPDLRSLFGGVFDVDFTLVGDGTGANITTGLGNQIGTAAAPIDPLLGPLANNGGTTRTHAILAGSPAINTGDAASSGTPLFDQREKPFVRREGVVDIGAYERQTVSTSLVVDHLIDEQDGNLEAGFMSLREAIAVANGSLGPDVITFDGSLDGTIHLGLGELEINESLTIRGRGAM